MAKSLEKQCEELNWVLEVVHAEKAEKNLWILDGEKLRVEELILKILELEDGVNASWCEGMSIITAMKCGCLGLLTELNRRQNNREDAIKRYFEAQCTILQKDKVEIVDAIRKSQLEDFERNLGDIFEEGSINKINPRLSADFILKLFKTAGSDFLADIADVFFEDPYAFRSGWADIIVIKDQEISFVEVKTTDTLMESQLRFATKIANVLNFNCKVIQVKPIKN